MLGTTAQLVSLISHANDFLIAGNRPDNFFPNNTTFHFCSLVDFRTNGKKLFSSKTYEKIVADNPNEWFHFLKKIGCKKLRLYYRHSANQSTFKDYQVAGMVGQGGLWLIECIYEGYSDYWDNKWAATNQNAPNNKPWNVHYCLTSKRLKTINIRYDISETKAKLKKILTEISGFALRNELNEWNKHFNSASNILESKDPQRTYYYKDLIVSKNYPLIIQQILFAAGSAWAFGGMGSWNDLGFEKKEINEEYEKLSEKLYDCIIEGIICAVNTF